MLQSVQTETQLYRADQLTNLVDSVLVFQSHSDLLAKMVTESARPIY